MLLIAIYYY